jgi:cleavage and polyadenylation specificity factor subunit 4
MAAVLNARKEEQAQAVRDILTPQFHQLHLKVEDYLKFRPENPIKLDKDTQICRAALNGHCPLGPRDCPLRHTNPSPLNFKPDQQNQNQRDPRLMSTVSMLYIIMYDRLLTTTQVCKHWLRGLCKKSDACEFLHEYNLRRMPECWWYAKNGFCSAGEECLYAHPKGSQVECPDYNRGFCKLGTYIYIIES